MEAPLAMVTATLQRNHFTHRTAVDLHVDLADGTRKHIATLWAPELHEVSCNNNEITLGIHDEDGNSRGVLWVQNIERKADN